ncbi:MAG: magnesium-chelatase subunit BchH, partial [Pseudomonadota bacterium]
MRSRTSGAERTPVNVVIVTMDTHLATATEKARAQLVRELPGLNLTMHAASEWADDDRLLQRCLHDIAQGDIVIVTMLFLEDHFQPLLPALMARREQCDAMVCAMSASEVVKVTRLGKFDMGKPASGLMAMLKKLRGSDKDGKSKQATGGEAQMRMLRRLPQLLRFIPGTAQDVRAYFLTLQYWLGGSEENVANMVRFLIDRYADGPRKGLRRSTRVADPVEYPELGIYHPRMPGRLSARLEDLPALPDGKATQGTVGVLLLRSYLLAGNAGHYDGVIAALEARGLRVIPAFAAGLDARPAINRFFTRDGAPTIDALVSLSGFSLVGGPAYNDARAAEDVLASLDVPYVAAHPVEFQTLDQWGGSERGLSPVESTIMVAIPELDGATNPTVFGGRPGAAGVTCTGCAHACTFSASQRAQDMASCPERALSLAARVERLVALKRSERAQRRVAIVVFNFPPNAGNIGTAAFLGVFESLFNTLHAMAAQGYGVTLPETVDELRDALLVGNAAQWGSDANVHHFIPVDDHVRRER